MIRIGTRKSELALAQTDIVNNLLKKLNYETSVFEIQTIGDKILDVPLSSIGEKSLFTKELETALLENTVDIVVHSLKDVATDMPNGLILGSILEREIPHDVLVLPLGKSGSISSLPDNSVVGTGSVRRIGQLKRLFPNLIFKDCRGNLNTRLKKLDANDNYDALILAYAGLHRLNLGHRVSQVLDFIYHAVGQAAIAIQCRSNDEAVLKMLNTLSHRDTLIKCTAERAFMRRLEGGCSVPLGVSTRIENASLFLQANVTSVDGVDVSRDEMEIVIQQDISSALESADKLGVDLGNRMISNGVQDILNKIRK